jgi:hypothetical protein
VKLGSYLTCVEQIFLRKFEIYPTKISTQNNLPSFRGFLSLKKK